MSKGFKRKMLVFVSFIKKKRWSSCILTDNHLLSFKEFNYKGSYSINYATTNPDIPRLYENRTILLARGIYLLLYLDNIVR